MADRRDSTVLRTHFDVLKEDLLRRLEAVTAHLPAAERDALADEMTRVRLRYEYRDMLRVPETSD